jgi:hypothetical protein
MPRRRVRELAVRLGVVQRVRKVDIVALVYSLVLGFAAGDRRSLTGIRRAYLHATGVRLAPSSFYARFNDALNVLVRTLALESLEQLASGRPKLRAVFAPFREVLAVDSALLRLHNALEPFYPSVWTHYMKASIKLGMVMNVVGRSAKSIVLSAGSRHDTHLLQVGSWMKGRLLLFDLGFFGAALFHGIAEHGGYFLCRMRKHGNPVIVRVHGPRHQHLVGAKLRDALNVVDGDILDVDAQMVWQRKHGTRPRITTHYGSFRFVSLYNAERGQWHGYVTNLPPSAMQAQHFAAVYAARWEVELLFRELKTRYRLDNMPSANRNVTETLIYASLLTLAVSRRLYRALTTRWRANAQRIPFDRWAALVSSIAGELLALVLNRRHRGTRTRRIERYLCAEACDPNAARIPLAYRAQMGTYDRA